jgi:hypothetical protein
VSKQENAGMDINRMMSFGDFRRALISDIAAIRDGTLSCSQGTAMAAMYKEVNSNIQAEINATKLSLATEEKAHNFGKIVQMGKRLIGNGEQQEST